MDLTHAEYKKLLKLKEEALFAMVEETAVPYDPEVRMAKIQGILSQATISCAGCINKSH